MQLKFKKKLKTHFWTISIGIGTSTNVVQLGRQIKEHLTR